MEGSDMEAKRLTLRKATEEDIDILFEWINGLAAYEKRPQDMTGTKEQLKEWLFEKQVATALLAENEEGHNIGYAIYYPTFGSFSEKSQRPCGGFVYPPRISSPRIWQGIFHSIGGMDSRRRLHQTRMELLGLEYPIHRILSKTRSQPRIGKGVF